MNYMVFTPSAYLICGTENRI